METLSEYINTPIGKITHAPGFKKTMESLKTKEDLFSIVEEKGFVNPDAFAEIECRGLYVEYLQWKRANPKPVEE